MAQPHVIFEIIIHCLYLANLNQVLRFCDIDKYVERWNDDLEIAGSRPLYSTIFLP